MDAFVVKKVIDPLGRENRRRLNQGVHFVIQTQQMLGEIRAVLSRYSGYKSFFHFNSNLMAIIKGKVNEYFITLEEVSGNNASDREKKGNVNYLDS